MKKLVTAEIMKQLDKLSFEQYGIKPSALMENAGKCVFETVKKYEGSVEGKKVSVVCGKGNNGGDGLSAAFHLITDGADVTVTVLAGKDDISEESKEQLKKLSKKTKNINFISSADEFDLAGTDLVIDAIFGTGFNSNPEGLFYDVIKKINDSDCRVYSIDIPSCIHGTTGNAEDIAVFADNTITLGYPKIGLYINDGYLHSGAIDVVDIGLPKELDDEILDTRMLLEESDATGVYRKRSLTCEKKDFGKIFNFSGSLSMPGAAALSSLAALKAGCGLIKLGIPMNISASISTVYPEVMTIPLGYAQPGFTSMLAEKDVIKGYRWADALLVGPGLSVHPETKKVIKRLIQKFEPGKPVVLDADALNTLAEVPDLMNDLKADVIITPHNGEMARLCQTSKELFLLNRLEITVQKAIEWKCFIILKGTPTLIACPDGKVMININKNPGLAKGGTGDVLAGIVVSLLGQKISRDKAAVTALFVHSIAGQLATDKMGEASVLPSDLVAEIPAAVKYLSSLEK
ncbi:MAG: NAD(P)H-hydrate dehydratase [Candidatus Delongbacteria bacterium]|jgi:NAD(P)H-hydrate epimerase|nr:NAD(P)H-hydrate dehydratase [Candidatus Delongbacteria bacterium]